MPDATYGITLTDAITHVVGDSREQDPDRFARMSDLAVIGTVLADFDYLDHQGRLDEVDTWVGTGCMDESLANAYRAVLTADLDDLVRVV
jgi:hypothetical protein